MKILVFSDWHLDAKDALGWFGWDEKKFIKKLQKIITHYQPDKIVLNGDIFELYRYRKVEIVRRYPELLRFLQRYSVIYVRGNHDSISHVGLDYYEISYEGRRILIVHGHQADFFNGNRVIRFFVRLGMKGLRLLSHWNWVRNLYMRVYRHLDTKPLDARKENDFKYVVYALRLLDKQYDAVILGHTHQLEDLVLYQRGRKKYYLNSGTCSQGRFQGIFLDVSTWTYALINEE
ncbi:MAG: metallophosphoesterase family protein [Brevinematales bacterium]|nr:metallophosphoesterase family protein [Brevinematales bacterium]